MADVARPRRRPAAAKLPASTTLKNTLIWSMVGVPGLGISKTLNVNSGNLPVFRIRGLAMSAAEDAKGVSIGSSGRGGRSSDPTKDQAHVEGRALCGSYRPRSHL